MLRLYTACRHQPIDVSSMIPLSSYYEQEVKKWLLHNPGRSITNYQIGKLFKTAFSGAEHTAMKEFVTTEFFPYNNYVFTSSKTIKNQ